MNAITKADVLKRAAEVFSDDEKGLLWLNSHNPSLGSIPASLLDAEDGIQSVMDTLGRIEHGVFA
jgi:putative toxin-antitoxin system antitoxin component (TIGR02293 family)